VSPVPEPLVRDYLLLGLRLGRHIDGFVDCWFGDPGLARQAGAETPVPPGQLAEDAARLLAGVADSGLAAQRQRFLAAQLSALRCTARRLAGADIPFRAEVAACFELDIGLGDTDHYAAAQDAIADLLPGHGDLADRLEAVRERNRVPPERLRTAVQAVSDQLRALVRPAFGLPAAERVEFEVVRDRPWNAFNRYLGGLRSVVTLNAVAGRDLAALPLLAAHEAYPGHHTEHCLKEAGLVRERGQGEHVISLVNTPQCVLAEGAAEVGLAALLGPGWGQWTERVLAEQGLPLEGELMERLHVELSRLFPARQDAALLLHDRGADPEEVIVHLRRWLLISDGRARDMVRFLTDPLWRAYTSTYVEGARLVRGWLAGGAGTPAARLGRLLREPLLPAQLQAELTDSPD
jgi:hypothetical protein